MELWTILICLVLTLWLIWRWRITSTFQRLGIPGPQPNILFGNLLELFWKGPIKCHEEWVKKYGRVVGYYLGMTPAILVADPILLKNIYIKDFSKFINREAFNPISRYDPKAKLGQSVLNLPGEAWKSVRSVLTPTFTTAKMKQMSGSMQSSIEVMLKRLQEFSDKREEFDIFDVYQRITLDVITRTAFGVKTDVQTNMKSNILKATKLIFLSPYRSILIFVAQSFPLLRRVCLKIQSLILAVMFRGKNPTTAMGKGIVQVLQHRRQNPQSKGSDLLQLMIDNAVAEEAGEVDLSQLEAGNTENEIKVEKHDESSSKKTRTMSDEEIVSSALVVLLAGYETTSTALAFTTYFLAKHQDVQQKLFEEINDLYQNDKKLEYATVNRLEYLEKVFSESLRIKPPVYLFTNRYALTDVQYGNMKIPKGMLIRAPTYLMHHDPEFWQDPEKFDPERFSKKPNSNGITYFPFGIGPRNCLGMRFAQLEAKLVLAYVVYHFRIHLSDVHKEKLPTELRARTLTPSSGVRIKLEKRNEFEG